MDERTCEFLRSVAGVEAVQSADPAETLTRLGMFDVITMWHVLEHLPHPCETLRAAAEALAPGGVMVLALPNPASFQFALFRRYWTHLDAPRHLALIPAAAIEGRTHNWGLSTELETATDRGGLGWNHFGWQMSLRNLSRKAPDLLSRAAARAARPLERRDLSGSTYTLVLRKGQA
jgi:SAM-dependent methyltransferase